MNASQTLTKIINKVGIKETERRQMEKLQTVRCDQGWFGMSQQMIRIDREILAELNDPRESEAAELGHEDAPEWLAREE